MNLNFLDKNGLRNLRNILIYFKNPKLIEYPSQKTFLSKKENRQKIIISSFKNLTNEDKQLLIVYVKDKINVIEEIIETFIDFKTFKGKENIADFLYDLMKNVDDEQVKLKIFNLIYLNCASYSLKIIYETEMKEFKKKLYKSCVLLNLERGYVYGLLNNVEIDTAYSLDLKKLVCEINYIQSFDEHSILEIVIKYYDDLDNLIDEINNRIRDKDFRIFYTLAKNLKILDSYNFNINKNELLLLRWAIDITDPAKDNVFINEVRKKDLSFYSDEWLIFLSMNLLQMDIKKQKLSIMILNYLIDKKEFIAKYSDKIANDISIYIKDNKEIRYDLLEILKKLKTTKGFYNILDLIYEEKLSLTKNKKFVIYVSEKIRHTEEFRWLSKLEGSSKYVEPETKLKSKAVTFALREKSPKENYQLLSKLEEYNNNLYSKIMEDFAKLIANKLDDHEKYIKLMIVLNYQCKDKDVLNEIKKYKNKNSMAIIEFMKICDSSLLGEYYIKEIKTVIKKKNNSNIVKILQKIEEPQVKNKCSLLILESLIESDFNELINIWEHFSLDIGSKIKFKGKVLEMFINKKIQLTEKSIGFANEIGLDPVTLYNFIDDEPKKRYLLNIWYQSNEIGKIIDIIKEKISNEVKCLEDIKDTYNLFESYNINDHNIAVLIKIKAYTLISIELLELDIESEETISQLNNLADQLNFYGLIDRFLMDELLQKELDKRIVDYLFRRFMDNIDSDELWEYYLNNIMADLNNDRYDSYNGKVEIFLTYLAKSKKRIEWFLDIIDNKNIDHEIYVSILETLLVLSNKQNGIILQNEQEIDRMQDEILTSAGMTIGKALSNMERTIINRSNDIKNDILVENLKKFRRELKDVGIDSVEDIENYGKVVKFDNDIHEGVQLANMENGVVDSLGIRINNKNILLSTLLNID